MTNYDWEFLAACYHGDQLVCKFTTRREAEDYREDYWRDFRIDLDVVDLV